MITGPVSNFNDHYVTKLEAVVATIYPEGHKDYDFFKVWPVKETDPQLTASMQYEGKLWFRRSASQVEIIAEGVS